MCDNLNDVYACDNDVCAYNNDDTSFVHYKSACVITWMPYTRVIMTYARIIMMCTCVTMTYTRGMISYMCIVYVCHITYTCEVMTFTCFICVMTLNEICGTRRWWWRWGNRAHTATNALQRLQCVRGNVCCSVCVAVRVLQCVCGT